MTYFGRHDEEEPIPIKDGRGLCCNWCVGANLDEDEKVAEQIFFKKRNQERKERQMAKKLEKERKAALQRAAAPKKQASFFKKAFFWICGIEKQMNSVDMNAEEIPADPADTSIDQNTFWAVICDINAIIAMALAAFCFAFFNVYTD